MHTPQWYLIQYDIRCKKRLQRVHRTLKRCAYALQKSVFAWYGTAPELAVLQQQLTQLINAKEDDVRGYRIREPLLLFGQLSFIEGAYFAGYPPHEQVALEVLHQPPPLIKQAMEEQR